MSKLLLVFLFISSFSYAQDEVVQFYGDHQFEKASTQYMFGDNVKLRKKPSTDSDVLDTLTIGSAVSIIKMSKETMTYRGIDWNWYKIDFDGQIGYVLGGLIALTHEEIGDYQYLVSLKDNDEDRRFIQYRIKNKKGEYVSGETELLTGAFSIEAYDDRGIDGIKNMLFINYYAEACGVDGGGIYIFYDGLQLIKAIEVSSVVDGGVFWFNEEVTFPNEEDGQKGVIVYEREHGYVINEELNWTKAEINTLMLKWEDGKMTPDVNELDFDQEQE